MWGLVSAGFVKKGFSEILEGVRARINVKIPNMNFSDQSPQGQITAILADEIANLWEVAEDVYHSQYPADAEGSSLDQAVAYAAVIRGLGQKTTLKARFTFTVATAIPAKTVLKFGSVSFLTGENEVPASGLVVEVNISSENSASIPISEGALLNAPRAILNLTKVEAVGPVLFGYPNEPDGELRQRFYRERTTGRSTSSSIESAVSRVPSVISSRVIENNTARVVDGRPPNSIEIVVFGGADSGILEAIFNTVAPGTVLLGDEHTYLDDDGIERILRFSRAIRVTLRVKVQLFFLKSQLPDNSGDSFSTAVRSKIVNYINGIEQGVDVVAEPYLMGLLDDIPDLKDVNFELRQAESDSPLTVFPISQLETAQVSNSTVTVELKEFGESLDVVNITVSVTLSVDPTKRSETLAERVRSKIQLNVAGMAAGENVTQFNLLAGLNEEGLRGVSSIVLLKTGQEVGSVFIEIASSEVARVSREAITIIWS